MRLPELIFLDDVRVKNLISNKNYLSAADYLFKSQLNNWELMKKNYDALKNVQTKSIWFDGFKLNVQFNPERIKSTSAMVDENSIKNRKCFLCIENLPYEQKGILLPGDFLMLCNPYPIIPQHFTVSFAQHEPQQIINVFDKFLELTQLLSSEYSLVYNGPSCGASAPDHLHFQAGTKNFLPIENDIQQLKNDFGRVVQEEENLKVSFIDDGLRRLILIESTEQKLLSKSFEKVFKEYEKLSMVGPEPRMNILSNYDEEFGWSVVFFLRSKHRPDSFFKADPDKILISPAAIDLGGVIVTPRETDYLKVDKEMLHQIFNEVSLDKKTFSLLFEKIKAELH